MEWEYGKLSERVGGWPSTLEAPSRGLSNTILTPYRVTDGKLVFAPEWKSATYRHPAD